MDCNPPYSSVHGIIPAKILEWVAISSLNLPDPGMEPESESEVAQLCPTPSDPVDCNLPDSSVNGIFQARVLEWVAIAFSSKSPTIPALAGQFFTTEPPGKPTS